MVKFQSNMVQEAGVWVWHQMSRTKTLPSDIMETPLKRCLTTLDITLLGIGHMVGAGVYVLTGTVAKDLAGPSIIISFLLAGFVSLLAALCYAEFGARVPKAGSAYVYAYVTVGEFWAFVIGWNIILEHMIGAASVARAWSGYVDSLFHGSISNSTVSILGEMHEQYLADYPDPLAFVVTLIYCSLLTLGVKGSAYFNSIFTLVNMCVITLIVFLGFFYADFSNWQTPGGFAPFGLSGVIAGAATSFYAFVGFDSIATSGEEAINPTRSIPIATITAMGVVTVGYVFVGATLTLLVPYNTLNPAAAIPDAFGAIGLNWAKYLVSIGALCGMTTSLFGCLFSLPRCVYAMASDGLLFSWLAKVSDKTQVPVFNMVLCGFMSAVLALIFDIEKLVEFMSIGTLMAYTIVSASVIILRYEPSIWITKKTPSGIPTGPPPETGSSCHLEISETECMLRPSFMWASKWLSVKGNRSVSMAVIVYTVAAACFCSLMHWSPQSTNGGTPIWTSLLLFLLTIILLSSVFVVAIHKQNDNKLSFSVPMVPFLPLMSILFNVALMVHLNPMTWIRFVVWMALGLIVYFGYGVHNSKENAPVSAYSNLLTEAAPASETVFGDVQQKLSQVTSKILSTSSQASADEETKSHKKPIMDDESKDVP